VALGLGWGSFARPRPLRALDCATDSPARRGGCRPGRRRAGDYLSGSRPHSGAAWIADTRWVQGASGARPAGAVMGGPSHRSSTATSAATRDVDDMLRCAGRQAGRGSGTRPRPCPYAARAVGDVGSGLAPTRSGPPADRASSCSPARHRFLLVRRGGSSAAGSTRSRHLSARPDRARRLSARALESRAPAVVSRRAVERGHR